MLTVTACHMSSDGGNPRNHGSGKETQNGVHIAAACTRCPMCQSLPFDPTQEKQCHSLENVSRKVEEMFQVLRGVDALLRVHYKDKLSNENGHQQIDPDWDFRQWAPEETTGHERLTGSMKQVKSTDVSVAQNQVSHASAQGALKDTGRHFSCGAATPAMPLEGQGAQPSPPKTMKSSLKGAEPQPSSPKSLHSETSSGPGGSKDIQKKMPSIRSQSSFIISSKLSKKAMADLSCLGKCTASGSYGAFVAIMILANSVNIGIQTEWAAAHPGQQAPMGFRVVDIFFCIFFSVELSLRFYLKPKYFFIGKERSWNVFDTVVVLISVIEEIIIATTKSASALGNLTFLRVLRVLRLIRVLRVVRVFRFFRELRLLIHSIMGSIKSLVWIILLIMMMLYIIGVFLTQFVTDHLAEARQLPGEQSLEWEDELLLRYGSLLRSVYTLYMGMTAGMAWGEGAEPLVEGISPWFAALYSIYIAFALFAILNVVTGIFVESAMAMAQQDRDFVIQETMNERQSKANELGKIFREADISGDGMLSLEELEDHFADASVAAYLQALDLDVSSTRAMFQLLDADKSGHVEISEFMEGCRKLTGTLSSLDFAMSRMESQRNMHQLEAKLTDRIEKISKEVQFKSKGKAQSSACILKV
eukprot:gnl/MRDRNA2_/MRDRNA2_49290_c0_seq1.p1 gnl/MRDRNA2_/MRDRNA2_49290_c0~~gnl/MRDRNA2_/MRDRNA2_49290_c0_seq1.p1  ORF type:complete len:645 (+),score=102.50 gnl/MRDRNA2_/MRDRNA2_49290_c0_seq1:89-2023(+)